MRPWELSTREFLIDGPAVISFSGGRTSAFMLYQILDCYSGQLPDDLEVVFCNTGKELPETLNFVQRFSDEFGVTIVWLECRARPGGEGENKYVYETVQTDFERASRNGEPFESLIRARGYLPNPVARFCTQELKILRMRDYMKSRYGDEEWVNVIGIRADEHRRFAKLDKASNLMPLYRAGVTKEDVSAFWENCRFDLELPNNNGVTDWGNCDLCFLKGYGKKQSIIHARPDLAPWWSEQEAYIGGYFRSDQPSYAQMQLIASSQMPLIEDDESISCFCGD